MCATRFGIRYDDARRMTLEERAILEAGLEWEAEQAEQAPEGSETGASSGQNFLNLDEMAALGAEVS